ncbi:uncharacterized protein K489DRAFT_413251 [Dissoconium aciculare CBS 342.82]|uniref:Uncharacterized protein n=1 Tax=Dissoconium aciculare CBS 342.82 TaxID=1314786 RepID=A0A6J3LT10_9PEZI|nr:uncharacterized protein K489DRAFT_413251 [Dissoconium aciculare CBS 342.82]KAF1818783.1 hypothetical protein K489DRAFT_413251 [Dissoconium aciculare CBS 342.82]
MDGFGADEFTFLDAAVELIHELLCYKDGLRCQLDAGACLFVARSPETMRSHWRKAYRR